MALPGAAFYSEVNARPSGRRVRDPRVVGETPRHATNRSSIAAGNVPASETRPAPGEASKYVPQAWGVRQASAETNEALTTRVYHLGDVIERFATDFRIADVNAARQEFATYVDAMAAEPRLPPHGETRGILPNPVAIPAAGTAANSDAGISGVVKSRLPRPEAAIKPAVTAHEGDTLVLIATPSGHERIASALTQWRNYGFQQFAVEVRIIAAPGPVIMNSAKNWNVTSVAADHDQIPSSIAPATSFSSSTVESSSGGPHLATSTVEKQFPVCHAILDEHAADRFCARLQEQRNTNMILAPKVTMLNSQSATIQDTTERSLLVGLRLKEPPPADATGNQISSASERNSDTPTYEPQFRLVREGTTIQLRPTQTGDDRVRVDLQVDLEQIKSIRQLMLPVEVNGKRQEVQVPEIAALRIQLALDSKLGQSHLLYCPAAEGAQSERNVALLITIKKSALQ